jgi:2-polyprenyl-3-methyl-5-hydroxy-6-metoxy-1,4-benzoquinol methylase
MSITKKYFLLRNKEESLKNPHKRNIRSFETINDILEFSKKLSIKKESKFLDLGCGDKSFIDFLKGIGIQAEGCDIDTTNFETDKLPYSNDNFDHIMLYSVIEHVQNSDHFLIEIKRILKKDGNLIIITPNFKYCFKSFYDDPTHIKPFTVIGLEKILKIYDFKNIFIRPWTVNYRKFIWRLPFSFFYCSKILPFRNDENNFLPKIFKGKSDTMIAVCQK